jgi:Domain of unknown function (DUF1937)
MIGELTGLGYLATPYSKYPHGIERAFIDACELCGQLLKHGGLKLYSPIAHTHCIALYGKIDPLDLSIWIPFDETIMSRCDYLIVAHMTSWTGSKGIAAEVEFFKKHENPVYDLDPITMRLVKRRSPIHTTFESEL